MEAVRVKLGEGGRIVIPASHRHALGLKAGDELVVRIEGGELRMVSAKEAMRQMRALIGRYVPDDVVLSDELIAQRRAEKD